MKDRVRLTASRVDEAKRNVEALRQNLAAKGQMLMPEIASAATQVDGFLEKTRADLERRDVVAAEEDLGRVNYLLQKVFKAVGGG